MTFVVRKMIYTDKDGSYIKNPEFDPYVEWFGVNTIRWSWYQESAEKFIIKAEAKHYIESAYKNYSMPFLIENRLYVEEVFP